MSASASNGGFKPQQMIDLLGVSKDTFRYWREQLDPYPNRKTFSTKDLAIYRLVKYIQCQHRVSVSCLKKSNFKGFFIAAKLLSYETLSQAHFEIDTHTFEHRLLMPDSSQHRMGEWVVTLSIRPILDENIKVLQEYGE